MKRSLAVSTMLVCAALLLAGLGTFAFFSDSASSTGNTFSTGAFHFNIKDPGTTGHTVFNVTNMKPGDVATGYIAVTNDSSAGMNEKYKAWITGSGALGSALSVRVTWYPSDYTGYSALTGSGYTVDGGGSDIVTTNWTPISSLGSGNPIVYANPDPAFQPGHAQVYKIEVRMDAAADNTYQGTSYSGAIDFAATQYENPGW